MYENAGALTRRFRNPGERYGRTFRTRYEDTYSAARMLKVPWPNDEIRIVDRSRKSNSIIGSDGWVIQADMS